MTNETFIAVMLTSHDDVEWLNECYKNVGAEEMLPVQHAPHNAFYSKTPSYTTIRLVKAKQLPMFTAHPCAGTEDPHKYYFTLTAPQLILDLFIANLKEKLTVLRWPWKVTMVEV